MYLLRCLMCKSEDEFDPFEIYLQIVRNKTLDSTKKLVPLPTYQERQLLLHISDFLSEKAQDIIYSTCVDNGAGIGIST